MFESDSKFDGLCGWPSFDKPLPGKVEYVKDISHGILRTEILCSNYGGHRPAGFTKGRLRDGVLSAKIKFTSEM